MRYSPAERAGSEGRRQLRGGGIDWGERPVVWAARGVFPGDLRSGEFGEDGTTKLVFFCSPAVQFATGFLVSPH